MAKFRIGICPKCGHRFPLTSQAVGQVPFTKGVAAVSIAKGKARDGIDKACADLALSDKVKVKAQELFALWGLFGRTPPVAVGGYIYIAAKMMGEPRGQRDVSFAAGCTEVSIRNSYQALTKKMKPPLKLFGRRNLPRNE